MQRQHNYKLSLMNKEKQIKALISGIISNDEDKVNDVIKSLSEAIIIEKNDVIVNAIMESLKGVYNV